MKNISNHKININNSPGLGIEPRTIRLHVECAHHYAQKTNTQTFTYGHVRKFWKDFGTLELGLKVCF